MRQNAKTRFARHLRKQSTPAETSLWFHLRRNQLQGFRFRRQHPLGPFIVDFICLEKCLIIEVDGSQHLASDPDKIRDKRLCDSGYRILRFWNHDVLDRLDEVLAVIVDALTSDRPLPPSAPSPAAQGKGNSYDGAR